MTTLRLLLIVATFMLPGLASGLTPPPLPCEDAMDRTGYYIRWVNERAQQGATLTFARSDDTGQSTYSFEDCRSGTRLQVGLSEAQTNDWENGSKPVEDAFYTALRASESFTFKKLRRAFRRAGYSADIINATSESCGCYIYYPHLRGSKTPYEARR